jgi:hypothetical protein
MFIDRPVVQVPITWPLGTYGLMKATNGCPGDNTRWQEGWRKFDTEDTFSSHNSFSSGIQHYLAGISTRLVIIIEFEIQIDFDTFIYCNAVKYRIADKNRSTVKCHNADICHETEAYSSRVGSKTVVSLS